MASHGITRPQMFNSWCYPTDIHKIRPYMRYVPSTQVGLIIGKQDFHVHRSNMLVPYKYYREEIPMPVYNLSKVSPVKLNDQTNAVKCWFSMTDQHLFILKEDNGINCMMHWGRTKHTMINTMVTTTSTCLCAMSILHMVLLDFIVTGKAIIFRYRAFS